MINKERFEALYNELDALLARRHKFAEVIDHHRIGLERANMTFCDNEKSIFNLERKIKELRDKEDEGEE